MPVLIYQAHLHPRYQRLLAHWTHRQHARWPDGILTDHLQPTSKAAGVGKIGWHTFRHTYSTLLHALGTTPAVQKERLRRASIQTTLNLYTQAVWEDKREAASKVVGVLWKN